jgi:hypothetical protein
VARALAAIFHRCDLKNLFIDKQSFSPGNRSIKAQSTSTKHF